MNKLSEVIRSDFLAAQVSRNWQAAEECETLERLAAMVNKRPYHLVSCGVYDYPQQACDCGKAKASW